MTETEDDPIVPLNSLLRGEVAAVETYRQATEKVTDAHAREVLQQNGVSHAARVQCLRQEIVRLGGEPAEGSGAWGTFAKAVEGSAKLLGDSAAIAALEQGEDRGVKDYCDLCQELPSDLQRVITAELLPEQRRTHEAVVRLKESMAESAG